MNFENRGAQKTVTDYNSGSFVGKLNLFYIAVPLKFGVVVGRKFSGITNVGIVPVYLVGASEKVKVEASKESYSQFLTSMVSKFDVSALAELGVGYRMAPLVSVYGTFRFQPGD